jgi:hypothetical protein
MIIFDSILTGFFYQASNFEATGAKAKIDSSLKSNHQMQI